MQTLTPRDSAFRICITRPDGQQVHLHPGAAAELDFITDVVRGVVAKGVGIFSTTAHVQEAVRLTLTQLLWKLKSDVRP